MPKTLKLTREKHLDHMVRVVPLVVFGFIVQSYLITSIDPNEFGKNMVLLLAFLLGGLIAGLSVYDVTHEVTLTESQILIEVRWMGLRKEINFTDIMSITSRHPDQTFTAIEIKLKNDKKQVIYFVDGGIDIQKWIKDQSHKEEFGQAA